MADESKRDSEIDSEVILIEKFLKELKRYLNGERQQPLSLDPELVSNYQILKRTLQTTVSKYDTKFLSEFAKCSVREKIALHWDGLLQSAERMVASEQARLHELLERLQKSSEAIQEYKILMKDQLETTNATKYEILTNHLDERQSFAPTDTYVEFVEPSQDSRLIALASSESQNHPGQGEGSERKKRRVVTK